MKTRENPGTNGMIPPLEHSVFPPFTGMDKIYRRLQVHPAETLALADMEARADAYELNRKSDTILGQEKTDVAKIMKCRSVGLDCDFVAHGETEAQVMEKVAQHAKKDHGMHDIPEDVATKVRAAIRDE